MGFVKLPWYSCYTKAKTLASKWRLLGSLASSDSLHWEGDSPQNITAKSAKWPEIKMIWVWFICIKKHKLGFPIRSFPIHSLFTDQLFGWGNWLENCGEQKSYAFQRVLVGIQGEPPRLTAWPPKTHIARAKKCTDTVVSSPKRSQKSLAIIRPKQLTQGGYKLARKNTQGLLISELKKHGPSWIVSGIQSDTINHKLF